MKPLLQELITTVLPKNSCCQKLRLVADLETSETLAEIITYKAMFKMKIEEQSIDYI